MTGGVALTVVVAAGLYLSGRLDGPALFGGSALAETLIVSAAAAALAWWGVTRKRGRAPARKPPPHDNAGSAADTGDI